MITPFAKPLAPRFEPRWTELFECARRTPAKAGRHGQACATRREGGEEPGREPGPTRRDAG